MEPEQDEEASKHASAPPAATEPSARPSSSSTAASDPEMRTVDHDSMVTVRLSEPPSLTINTSVGPGSLPSAKGVFGHEYKPSNAMAEAVQEEEGDDDVVEQDGRSLEDELRQEQDDQDQDQESEHMSPEAEATPSSDEAEEIDWDELQKTEDQESKGQDSDNTTMLLARLEHENAKFATNPNTVKVQVVEEKQQQSPTRQPRPPSMAQLRDMVQGPTAPVLRYSMIQPPPMTDLEFYSALVKDYQQTAARLPTLLSNKIRKGIPPPLRGVVWQSMSGARDSALEEQFERFSGESSPYEGIIGKDLGRSFPGVDMFRDPEGDGQRMLGRVLKCYSLHERKIGYCQGLAFLVGPLLMHMPDRQAYCVLVKLMEDYDLRNSYTPELSGLHVRIYQFRELLRGHLPVLSSHLDALQVDPAAYVSQWFLSFFAVTCPLPMVFRIFDVAFAEGASETIMRVALSLMQKNQRRILACSEMEDVMQLLLSRGLWDCYHYNADEFVDDFTSLSSVVSRERLSALEQGCRQAQIANITTGPNAARRAEVTTAASNFLGRLWVSTGSSSAPSIFSPKSSAPTNSTLSPGLAAPLRPLSMLRRTTSKQSLASTLNSMEAGSSSSSVLSSASTDATSLSRDSAASDDPSARESAPAFHGAKSNAANPGSNNSDSRYLHSQIEDLLTALSDLQRQHALLADQLQREREERAEDRKVVRTLLDGLRKRAGQDPLAREHGGGSEETIKGIGGRETPKGIGSKVALFGGQVQLRQTDGPGRPLSRQRSVSSNAAERHRDRLAAEDLSGLLDPVEERFGAQADNRRSSVPQTKSQLRDELARAKEQLANELAKSQDCNRRVYEMEQEVATMKEQVRESHVHVRNLHQDKQRLEKQMQGLRVRASAESAPASGAAGAAAGAAEAVSEWFGRTTTGTTTTTTTTGGGGSSGGGGSGLRELKLGRSRSTPSQASNGPSPFGKRMSSVLGRGAGDTLAAPANEHEALLMELVQAKTSKAVAEQEAEEAKQKLETLRKAFGLAPGDTPSAAHNSRVGSMAASQASAAASAAMGMFGRFTASTPDGSSTDRPAAATPPAVAASAPAPTTSTSSGYGGFFGWRRG